MPPYTYKFVKNQNNVKQKKIGSYLSKDVKVINDLIDDLSKLKTADNAEMTNPLEVDDKESSQSISSSCSRRSDHKASLQQQQQLQPEKPKLKEQVLPWRVFMY